MNKKYIYVEIFKIENTGELKGHLVVLKICKIYTFNLLLFFKYLDTLIDHLMTCVCE